VHLLVKAVVFWGFDGNTELSCTKRSRTDTEGKKQEKLNA
jgi:hypothetical protein